MNCLNDVPSGINKRIQFCSLSSECVCFFVFWQRNLQFLNIVYHSSTASVFPELFSDCSLDQLSIFLENVNPSCLLDHPSSDRLYGGPVCGNAFLDPGEECDCGRVEVSCHFYCLSIVNKTPIIFRRVSRFGPLAKFF